MSGALEVVQELKWVNFPSGAAYTAEAKELYDLADCSIDASALDDLVLQAIESVRTSNTNAPSVFGQTFEALLCTRGVTLDDALDMICAIASETNTSGNTRAVMAPVATGSSTLLPLRPGDGVGFCATCFGVGHGASVCPAKPEYSEACCCFCRNGGHGVSGCTHLDSGDGRLRWGLGDPVPTKLYPPRGSRERRFSANGSHGSPGGDPPLTASGDAILG